MVETADFRINTLVSNVIEENRFSHCRLCLAEIGKEYIRLEDPICIDACNNIFQPLNEVISALLQDEKITDYIPGIDAACLLCTYKAIETIKFVNMCKNSSEILNSVFDNILMSLDDKDNVVIDQNEQNKSLYIAVNETDLKCVLIVKEKDENELTNKKHKQYICDECDIKFNSILYLVSHNHIHHGTFTCKICHETFTSRDELDDHKQNRHLYQCSQCHITKSSDEGLEEHMHKVHNLFVCKICGKSCLGLNNLQTHERIHTRKDECPKCGKSYTTKGFYMKHVKLCLENRLDPHPMRGNIKKTYFCDQCNKGYSTEGGLRVHMRFVHGNAKPHVCDQCGKKFTAPSYLKTHMVTHTGEKNFKCDICNNKFVSKEALLYHTRRHTGEKPYSCNMCHEKFVNASARAEHIKFRHVAPTFMCDICSRKFVTSHFLKMHMARHNDPASKLYLGRTMFPANVPGGGNMRVPKIERES